MVRCTDTKWSIQWLIGIPLPSAIFSKSLALEVNSSQGNSFQGHVGTPDTYLYSWEVQTHLVDSKHFRKGWVVCEGIFILIIHILLLAYICKFLAAVITKFKFCLFQAQQISWLFTILHSVINSKFSLKSILPKYKGMIISNICSEFCHKY